MIASTYDTLESVLFLVLGFLPYTWDKALEIGASWFGYTAEDEIKMSLIFLLLVTIVGTITSLPFEIYSTFAIEKKHGFNKQTYLLFFTDKVKSLLLTFAIGGPFIAFLLKIIMVCATVEGNAISIWICVRLRVCSSASVCTSAGSFVFFLSFLRWVENTFTSMYGPSCLSFPLL
jgi:hypothetical protein